MRSILFAACVAACLVSGCAAATEMQDDACASPRADVQTYSEAGLTVKGIRLDVLPIGKAPVLRIRRDMGLVLHDTRHKPGRTMLSDPIFENLVLRKLDTLAKKGCRVEEVQVGFDVVESLDSSISETLASELRSSQKPLRLIVPAATRATETAIALSPAIQELCARSRPLGFKCRASAPVSLEVLAFRPGDMDAPSSQIARDAGRHLQPGQWFAITLDPPR